MTTEKRSIARQTIQKQEHMRNNVQPPHRVVQREVIDWANGLNGRAPIGDDLCRLVASLASAVEQYRPCGEVGGMTDAIEGDLDTVVQLIHKHVGVRDLFDGAQELTGVEAAAKAILADHMRGVAQPTGWNAFECEKEISELRSEVEKQRQMLINREEFIAKQDMWRAFSEWLAEDAAAQQPAAPVDTEEDVTATLNARQAAINESMASLEVHPGVLLGLSPEEHRKLNEMGPGPLVEVGTDRLPRLSAASATDIVTRLRGSDDRKCPWDSDLGNKIRPEIPCPVCGDCGDDQALNKPVHCIATTTKIILREAANEIERLRTLNEPQAPSKTGEA